MYGKSKVYWADQGQYGEIDADEMRAYEARGGAAQEELAALKQRRKELESQISALSSALTPEQLEEELKTYRKAVPPLREKLEKLASGGMTLVTPEQRARAKAFLDRVRKAWVNRKRMVTDTVDSMAEGLETKPKKIYDAIGVDTDEGFKVNIADCTTWENHKKKEKE
jgi:chromosome segregation ATPase